jgi:hypothetical protein
MTKCLKSPKPCDLIAACDAMVAQRTTAAIAQYAWKRNKKVAIKHGFEGARELILAWHGLRVCASASPLGGQCHFSSPRVLHS